MPHPIRPPFPPGKGAFRVPLKPPQCKECDTAPSKSLPCVRGGVSRSADGGVVGANYVIKRPGGELYGSCTLQNQCAAARRPQISLRRVGAQFIPLQKRPRPRCRAATKKEGPRHSWVYIRQYCAEIDEAARNRMALIVRSLAEQNGVTEQLKAENQMEWVRQMNACKTQAEEIVKAELIYD